MAYSHLVTIEKLQLGSSPQSVPDAQIYRKEVENISATELQAVQDFVDAINDGTDVSAVITQIDLL